jgi:hypothetical protein
MSELQYKLDRGEINPQKYFNAWDAEMEEKERLYPRLPRSVVWVFDGVVSRVPASGRHPTSHLLFPLESLRTHFSMLIRMT